MPQEEPKPRAKDKSLKDLEADLDSLKDRIEEAKHRNDMPLDSALGKPAWERKAADGSLDVPDDEDE